MSTSTAHERERPRVRRMVLFKHGLAYVERGGPCEGSFELSFEREEMKDVLKSLAVWVAAGDARPSAIAFEKPDDPQRALESRGLALPDDQSFSALLSAFRGRRASVREEGAGEPVRGEIIGLETRHLGERSRALVALRIERGAIRLVDLERVRDVRLEDAVAAADLDLLLERRRAASSSERRTVQVGVDGRAEDLRVAYVLPAPVWRVSYRIVSDDETSALAAWAVVHNPLDEDAEDVELTLTTGQPISFDIDLYRPKTVRRVVVEESARVASAPTQYERAPRSRAEKTVTAAAMAAPQGGFGPPGAPMPAAAPAPAMFEAAAMARGELLSIAEGSAALEDRGELFEYRIAQPITLPRGGSVLAPLLGARIATTKERIWRDGAPPPPDLVIAFRNETGAVLEEGPAVIYDQGVYAGEAMVPYTVRGAEVKLAFAKDLAVRCKRESSTRFVGVGLRLSDRFVAEEQRVEDRHVLRVDSDHDEEIEIVLELPRRGDRAIAEDRGAKPFEETASWRRFRAKVPPRSFVELEVIELGHASRRLEYGSLTPAQLDHWLRDGMLESGPMREGLAEIVATWAEAASHDRRAQELEAQRNDLQSAQQRITQQLAVLRSEGPEGELRLRYVRELGQAQDRVIAAEQEIAATREAAQAARRRAELRLAQLLGRAPA